MWAPLEMEVSLEASWASCCLHVWQPPPLMPAHQSALSGEEPHRKKPPEQCPCGWELSVWVPLSPFSREQRSLCPSIRPVGISSQLAPPKNHTGMNYIWMRSPWAVPQWQRLVSQHILGFFAKMAARNFSPHYLDY